MKRNTILVGAILLPAFIAAAQDRAPKMEFYLGYDYLRAHPATDIPSFGANGGGGEFAYNFNSWLGAVADVYAVHNGNVFGRSLIDTTSVFYQAGPRVSMRRWPRFTPYVQFLAGAQTAMASVPISLPPGSALIIPAPGGSVIVDPNSTNAVTLRAQTHQQTGFAYLTGGGVDIRINERMSIRPIDANLQFTRLSPVIVPDTQRSQYNFRYSAGVNFTFGNPQ
jgi:opacity protein-like surface antigen